LPRDYPNKIGIGIYTDGKCDKTAHIKRTFGVEVECYGVDGDFRCNNGFKIVEDGSLNTSEYGQEYVSGILQGNKGLEMISEQFTALKNLGYRVTRDCGFHVHIGVGDLTDNQIINVVSFLRVFEPLIYSMLPNSRQSGTWSQRLEYSLNHLNTFKKDIPAYKRHIATKCRYYGINLASIRKHGTLEFRYHAGTLNPEKMINWIKLLLRIVEYQKDIFWDTDKTANPLSVDDWYKFYTTLALDQTDKGLIKYLETRKRKWQKAVHGYSKI